MAKFNAEEITVALRAAGLGSSARQEVLKALGVSTPKTRTLKVVIESDVAHGRNATLDHVIKDAIKSLEGVTRVKTGSVGTYQWQDKAFENLPVN